MAGRFVHEKQIYHDGLKAFRVVRGATEEEVAMKSLEQLEIWRKRWASIQAAEQARSRKAASVSLKEQGIAAASERTQEIRNKLEEIEGLLESTISHSYERNWELLKRMDAYPESRPAKPKSILAALKPIPAPPSESQFIFKPTLTERLIPSLLNRRKAAIQAKRIAVFDAWQAEVESINAQNASEERRVAEENSQAVQRYETWMREWEARKELFKAEQQQWNQGVDEQRERYAQSDLDALVSYWYDLFSDQAHPDEWPEGCFVHYIPATKMLVVDYELPPIEVFPSVKEVRYIAARGEFKETPLPDSHRRKLYDDTIYRIALASLYKLFQSDMVDALSTVIFNGWVQSIDKATGAPIHPCILSVQAQKADFLALNLAHVDPRMCFKKLKGISGARLTDLSPVQPVLSVNRHDPRFVEGYTVVGSLNEGTNLAAMDWLDFENLIRELFEKEFSQNGGEVKITQASRDGGVDAIAFDPDPIRGGKIVIQAKRYTNTVGVSAIRDLFGTVHNEGAIKGILVTTSDFGPDAYEFAKGKPITLLSGSELLYLLQRHGYSARINLTDAKREWQASQGNKQSPPSSTRVN